jgi:hypothetical protein
MLSSGFLNERDEVVSDYCGSANEDVSVALLLPSTDHSLALRRALSRRSFVFEVVIAIWADSDMFRSGTEQIQNKITVGDSATRIRLPNHSQKTFLRTWHANALNGTHCSTVQADEYHGPAYTNLV